MDENELEGKTRSGHGLGFARRGSVSRPVFRSAGRGGNSYGIGAMIWKRWNAGYSAFFRMITLLC